MRSYIARHSQRLMPSCLALLEGYRVFCIHVALAVRVRCVARHKLRQHKGGSKAISGRCWLCLGKKCPPTGKRWSHAWPWEEAEDMTGHTCCIVTYCRMALFVSRCSGFRRFVITHANVFASAFWLLPTNWDETTWLASWFFQLCRQCAVHCQLSQAHFFIVWCWLLYRLMAWHCLEIMYLSLKNAFLFFKSQVSCGFRLFDVCYSGILWVLGAIFAVYM